MLRPLLFLVGFAIEVSAHWGESRLVVDDRPALNVTNLY